MGGWITTDNLHSGKLARETQNVSIANLIAQERRRCSAAMMEQVSLGTRRELLLCPMSSFIMMLNWAMQSPWVDIGAEIVPLTSPG